MGFSLGGLVLAIAIGGFSVAASPPTCSESVLVCDVDADGIVDVVEEAICGSATCATGTEDLDANGVVDADELAASLRGGGSGGPVQLQTPDAVTVITPDGAITQVSLWPLAGGAFVFLAAVGAAVTFRRARRTSSLKELAS
jgi:hypothetical protein